MCFGLYFPPTKKERKPKVTRRPKWPEAFVEVEIVDVPTGNVTRFDNSAHLQRAEMLASGNVIDLNTRR